MTYYDAQSHLKRLNETLKSDRFVEVLPKRVCHTLQKCKAEATSEQPAGKPNRNCSPRKIDVTRKLTVVSVSVVTLIRTDTTLNHSQKAEKV